MDIWGECVSHRRDCKYKSPEASVYWGVEVTIARLRRMGQREPEIERGTLRKVKGYPGLSSFEFL